MYQETREEQKDGEEEEEVIPSSQGEMFSSQSSTPDLLSTSHLIPILQPSQSVSEAEGEPSQQPRMEELVASTPSSSRPVEPSSPAEVQEISATTSDVRLDLSETPSEFDPPSPAAATAKRPLSDDPGVSPPDKRPRAAPSADDSDIQFVEEVGPDVQVVFSSQEPASAAFATPSAAAESQTGFRLNLSPSQSEEVTPAVVTVVSPAGHQSEGERDVEPDVEPDTEPDVAPDAQPYTEPDVEPETAPDVVPELPAELAGEVEVDPSHSPSSGAAADTASRRDADSSAVLADVPSDLPTVPSTESPQHHGRPAGSPAEASQPADEPADSSSSQGFQPTTTEPRSETTESAEARLPHIQTPQVASSGDSASPVEGDTVFGQAQRLIEEQNRRRELRDRPATSPSPPPPAPPRVEERVAVSPGEEEVLREMGAGPVEKPESATVEDQPLVMGGTEKAESITLEDEPPVVSVEDEPLVVQVEEDEPPIVPVEEDEPPVEDGEPRVVPVEYDESPVEEDEPPVVPVEADGSPVEDEPPVVLVEEEEPPVVPVEGDEPPVVPVEKDEPMVVTSPENKPGSSSPDDEPAAVTGRTVKPPLVTVEGGKSTPTTEPTDKPATATTEGQSKSAVSADEGAAPETRKEGDKIADDSQSCSQTVGSLLSDWRSVMKSPGRTTEISVSPAEGATDRQAGTATARTQNGVQGAERAPEAVESAPEAGAEAMEEGSSQELAEEPLPGGSAAEDPYRFHTTQSQETQPYRLRPARHIKPRSKAPDKSTSSGRSPSSVSPADTTLQRLRADLPAEVKKLSDDGYGLSEMHLTATFRKNGKEITKTFSLDEHDSAAFLRRITSSSFSSSGSSAGYIADVENSSKSSGGSGPINKRQSTLSSLTLSTIEGRGARHSISSSVDAIPAPGRRSVVSVQPYSPGSDGDVQVLSPPVPALPRVPEFTSPHGRPPRPHGQPTAVSSLRSDLDDPREQWSLSQLPPGLASPPAATSTQAERSSAEERPARLPGSQGSGSSHVTGSSPSPEIALQPPLSTGQPARTLTDAEEEELSGREQSELPRRSLQPDTPCFVLWVADKTYYPGRLVSETRPDRWMVRFDDGTRRQVPTEHILPVVNLWKGLSVFVQTHKEVYEAGIITGHRWTPTPAPGDPESLEYVVSLDSHPDVTNAVPRSRLSLTRDQAAIVRERRQPSLGQLTSLGSPSRHLSLDNLVTGRRRAAGAAGARRLANFETSCSDAAADTTAGDTSRSRRTASMPAASRRKGGKGKGQPAASKSKAAGTPKKTSSASAATAAKEPPSPSGGRVQSPASPAAAGRGRSPRSPAGGRGRSPRSPAGGRGRSPRSPAGGGSRSSVPGRRSRPETSAVSPASPRKQASPADKSPETTGRGRRGSKLKQGQSPPAAGATPAGEAAAATTATPSGRKRKRPTASTPTDESVATPSGRGRKRITSSTPTDTAAAVPSTSDTATASTSAAKATAGGRGRQRGSTSAQKVPEPAGTPVSRGGRGGKRSAPISSSSPEQQGSPRKRGRAGSSAKKQPEPEPDPEPGASGAAATATPGGRRSRKRLPLTPQEDNTVASEDSLDGPGSVSPLGEVPQQRTKLLARHTFILTCVDASSAATRRKTQRKLSAAFDKEHVSRHIEARGGHVLTDTSLTPAALERVRRRGDLLLISNGPLRTAKYITCLAMGVPCVELGWLQTSIRLNQCLPYEDYLLPAGHDPDTGEVVEQLLVETPPLARLRVLLAAGPDSEWGLRMAQILAAAGASVKHSDQDPALSSQPTPVDVVVTDPDCPPAVRAWARLCRTPVVSGEWVVCSVVAHRRLGFRARPEFHYRGREEPPDE